MMVKIKICLLGMGRLKFHFLSSKTECGIGRLDTNPGSSEALLSGQKPPFRLLVRAVTTLDNTRASHIRLAVSDAFVVSIPAIRLYMYLALLSIAHTCELLRLALHYLLPAIYTRSKT